MVLTNNSLPLKITISKQNINIIRSSSGGKLQITNRWKIIPKINRCNSLEIISKNRTYPNFSLKVKAQERIILIKNGLTLIIISQLSQPLKSSSLRKPVYLDTLFLEINRRINHFRSLKL
jgi:hypothetical protein